MPKKITKINFYNYKAFYSTTEDAYTIDLLDGKNLLIYGENGSGKSSIFDGLKDFFLSSIEEIEFNQNIISKGSIPKEPYIEVEFTDEDRPYYFSMEDNRTNTKTQPFIKDANEVKSFLSYKNLLALHYFRPKEEVNIFDILFSKNGILYNYKNPVGKSANGTDIPLGLLYANILKYAAERRNTYNYNRLLKTHDIILDFNVGVKKTLQLIIKNTNKYLNVFNQKFYLRRFEYIPLELNDVQNISERLNGGKLNLSLYFYKSKIPDYNLFLNEARLTALSLSIYFAAIKTIPPPEYQIIFLDDIFIGLDTSNRIPLLKLLKDYFLQDYQIIVTTYDKYWYEITRDYFGGNWSSVEMYVAQEKSYFKPEIVQSADSFVAKAKKYFAAYDYPAAGNYLRKECEYLVKKRLPQLGKISPSENYGSEEISHLETLFNNLIIFYKACNIQIPIELEESFRIYKKTVLNPLSHDDIKSNTYRYEIEQMFEITDKLGQLPILERKQVLRNGDKITYSDQLNNYKATLQLADNLYIVNDGQHKKFSNCSYRLIHWEKDSIPYWHNGNALAVEQVKINIERKRSLSEIFQGIAKSLSASEITDYYSNLIIGTNGTLKDLL